MSSIFRGNLPFEMSHEDEKEYRRLRFELEMKFKRKAEIRLRNEAEESKIGSSSHITRHDPFKVLDDKIIFVLNLLSGLELLKAMEVSMDWKKFIEGQDLLMSRALDEVRFKPNMCDISIDMQNSIFNEGPSKRSYKHMSVFFLMSPLTAFASSLHTLELTTVHPQQWWNLSDNWTALEFPKLKMIRFVGPKSFFLVLQKISLPSLTHLQLICDVPSTWEIPDREKFCCDAKTFGDWIGNFKSLKDLHVKCTFYYEKLFSYWTDDGTICENELYSSIDISMQNVLQHEVKKISIDRFYVHVMEHHALHLQIFEVEILSSQQLKWIMQNCAALEFMRIGRVEGPVDRDLGQFPSNSSIEGLSIGNSSLDCLQTLLLALPSLKKFHHDCASGVDANLIRFIALNLRHFEHLAIHPIIDEIRQAQEEIRANPELNSSFVIVDAKMEENKYQSPIESQFKRAFNYKSLYITRSE